MKLIGKQTVEACMLSIVEEKGVGVWDFYGKDNDLQVDGKE